ncbi:phosphatidylserine decarboxylase proenzyme, mitochondrial-like isoform X2 [Acanthaster planci]|uniref:Phosphatidylserine decarboxylase proenzyme, mitochondrial n=1 Tax=Acanthaster planci TaxID=133434 RepID=A0A8B7XZT0_ACAPL|nr:phosphatidylserine decarboxylase proenzyme, mitochondrial-like isoform X2 [Acanthaster planci]
MAIESLLMISQFPMLLSVFVLLELWYFIYTNLCPFLDRIPYFQRLNPCNACLRIGFHLLPLARFLALPSDGDPAALGERDPFAGEIEVEDFSVGWLFKGDTDETESSDENKNIAVVSSEVDGWRKHSINIYKALPLRFVSRLWGQVNSVDVPYGLRKPIYSLYTRLFNCDLSEALVEDLTTYQNLSAFFRRELKPTARPLDKSKSLVSPCDGKVLHFGKVERGWMEQVKGVTYTLQGFLGPKTANQQEGEVKQVSNDHFQSRLTTKAGNRLYQCILYLAPGDYHRFHSPADWTIKHRRHFPGLLFSVNPGIARWIRGLFSLNERVVLCGEWEHGFFSMTAVGATNVGSINIYFDEELRTNKKGKFKQGEYRDHDYTAITRDSAGIRVAKGDSIGEFNLGSTIVLIFEAPKDFDFSFRPGDKVRLNAGIGTL